MLLYLFSIRIMLQFCLGGFASLDCLCIYTPHQLGAHVILLRHHLLFNA